MHMLYISISVSNYAFLTINYPKANLCFQNIQPLLHKQKHLEIARNGV